MSKLKKAEDFVKLSFYDSVSREDVNIVELEEIVEELKLYIKEYGCKDEWIKDFFNIKD